MADGDEHEDDRPGLLQPAGEHSGEEEPDTPPGEREGEDPEHGYGQLAP